MSTTFQRFRTRSVTAYICLFGAFFGATVYGVASPAGLGYLWLVMGCAGVILTILKDASVSDSRVRASLFLADGLAVGALALVYVTMPPALGLLRGAVALIVAAVYVTLYFRRLFAGRIIAWEAQ